MDGSTAAPTSTRNAKPLPDSDYVIPHLRLIDCGYREILSPKSRVSFVALSYVWGPMPVINGPHSNLLDDYWVDPVVEGTVCVTAKLGYTHLWVDRHCIFQDDEVS